MGLRLLADQVVAGIPHWRAQRKLVEGGVHHGKRYPGLGWVLSQLTPEELRRIIDLNRSVIAEYVARDPQGLLAVGLEEARRHKELARSVVRSINAGEVLGLLEKRVPEHAAILRQRGTWYEAEVARAKAFLLSALDTG